MRHTTLHNYTINNYSQLIHNTSQPSFDTRFYALELYISKVLVSALGLSNILISPSIIQ